MSLTNFAVANLEELRLKHCNGFVQVEALHALGVTKDIGKGKRAKTLKESILQIKQKFMAASIEELPSFIAS